MRVCTIQRVFFFISIYGSSNTNKMYRMHDDFDISAKCDSVHEPKEISGHSNVQRISIDVNQYVCKLCIYHYYFACINFKPLL